MAESGVFIIGMSDCGEEVCAAAGRISTKEGSALEIMEKSHDKEKNKNLISKVTSSGHTSTTEHLFFNLAFQNVSVVVEQFMIEFRLASFTVKSRRYVDFSSCGYYIPEFKDEKTREKYVSHMDSLFSLYSDLTESGVPKEDARFVLPYCFYSNFFCSLGARELINVLRAMIYGRGRKIKEIYDIGLSLLSECKEKAPGVFGNFEKQYSKYTDEAELDFIETAPSENNTCSAEIISYTDNPADVVAKAVLMGEKGLDAKQAQELIKDSVTKVKVLSTVLKSSRARALESVSFTIRFSAVSLSTLTHFSRHRMQTLIIPALADCKRDRYVIASSISENEELLNRYIKAFEDTEELYNELKNDGYTDSETVYCLLSGNTIDFISVMNGRELKLFMNLRTCTRAQWEIRNLSIELLKKLRKISPELFSLFGPSCFNLGFCPEGKLTCGRQKEIKEIFEKI